MRFELDDATRTSRPLGAITVFLVLTAAPALIATSVPAGAQAPTTTPAPTATPVPTATPRIRVDVAWIRWLPAGLPAGGYMSLTNMGDTAVNLVAASSPAYAEVSIHRSVENGGTIVMQPVAQITIEPHSGVDFSAAGYHFMLMQPTKPLEPGGRVPISLRFADGSSLEVQFEVRK